MYSNYQFIRLDKIGYLFAAFLIGVVMIHAEMLKTGIAPQVDTFPLKVGHGIIDLNVPELAGSIQLEFEQYPQKIFMRHSHHVFGNQTQKVTVKTLLGILKSE